MKIKKETFIEDFIQTAIAQGEASSVAGVEYSDEEHKTARKLGNKLGARLQKMEDFLAEDPIFAKETLDKLVLNTNPYVMFGTAGMLWAFNYRMDDCFRLHEKVLENEKIKKTISFIAVRSFYKAIKEGRLERRREYPKLD